MVAPGHYTKNHLERYRQAFADWSACAIAGREQAAAVNARTLTQQSVSARTMALGTSGHVLDFDDTYVPGLLHLSAPTAPAALVVGASVEATLGEVLEGYAAGFEVMAALGRAGYPAVYNRGWHSTAVFGSVGAAVVASVMLGLDEPRMQQAQRLAILGAGGLRAAFGSEGKSIQVGMAGAQGVVAAQLAAAGATVSAAVVREGHGFEEAYGGKWQTTPIDPPAVTENWIKAYPCCLQTHGPIETGIKAATQGADGTGSGTVVIHPVSLQAAGIIVPSTGLEAKFSISYLTAFAILYGAPSINDFVKVNSAVRELAERIQVEPRAGLDESEAILCWRPSQGGSDFEVRVSAALGSPSRPMNSAQHDEKIRLLVGARLDNLLHDLGRPARDVLMSVEGVAALPATR